MEPKKTLIRARWIIAHDGRRHRILKEGELVWEGSEILYVGKHYPGPVDEVLDAGNAIVSPGLISTHAHLCTSPFDRSFMEDCGSPQFFFSGLYDYFPARTGPMTKEIFRTGLKYSLAELLRSGTTTVVDIGPWEKSLVDLVPVFGNRVYVGRGFRSGEWYTPDGNQMKYRWFDDQGMGRLEEAVKLIEACDGAHGGLVKGILAPGQADTCTEELLARTQEWAGRLKVPVTIHSSQTVLELTEMLRRTGRTSLAWLRDIGFLQSHVLVGHAIFIGGSSWSNYPPGDLKILSETGCSVAHAPWVFARRGMVMESFSRYMEAGVQMTLGTDTCPQNMLQAMRWAAVLSKVEDRSPCTARASDVFDAATVNGARALGRDDLGRLCPGAKADLVIFSGESMNMVPLRDPVKNIVYYAETEDVKAVIVNGRTVLKDGKLPGMEIDDLNRQLQSAGETIWANVSPYDWARRSVDDLSPLSYEPWA
jgi:5-methylthioadenosine/S-adenosylhomocysteine deaminase